MDADDLRALLTPTAMSMLDRLGPVSAKADPVRAITSLRADGADPRTAAVVLAQARLRDRAHAKLGPFADRMLFTEAGLEQATRLPVAARHADRFRRAGARRLADLGCGIGADSLAFASLGFELLAVDRDEVTAALATHNLAPFPDVRVECATADEVDLSEFDAVWLDPARRAPQGGRRIPSPAEWSPSLDFAFGLARADRSVGVKLAPGLPHDLLPPDAEAQWVSAGGELVECTVWMGPAARAGILRSALVLGQEGAAELTATTPVTAAVDAETGARGEWLYEPDPALIRARMIGDLARQIGGRMLSPGIAWITADEPVDTPFAARFRVLEELPLHVRALKPALRAHNIGTLEIKVRGADIDPATLRRQLGLRGTESATLVCTRVGEYRRALLAERR